MINCAISILAYLLPRWSTFLKYGKTELTPPTPGEIPQAIAQAVRLVTSATTFQFRHTTVRVRFKLLGPSTQWVRWLQKRNFGILDFTVFCCPSEFSEL